MDIIKIIKTAVILTVFNRKDVTLLGLHSLKKTMAALGEGYAFDIYMTDDGCTDGTGEAVAKEFPDIKIIKGDGNLFWSGGMRKAWQEAVKSGIDYDYYLWFNDDADLYENALQIMFNSIKEVGGNAIISGAFCDKEGNVSYGGRYDMLHLISPNGICQPIKAMNGNLVLIPQEIYKKIGIIDDLYKHGLGDYDYGLKAQEHGYKVLLTPTYVGITDRHDNDTMKCWDPFYSLNDRFRYLYSVKHDPRIDFIFNRRHFGFKYAIWKYVLNHIFTFFPIIYKLHEKKS